MCSALNANHAEDEHCLEEIPETLDVLSCISKPYIPAQHSLSTPRTFPTLHCCCLPYSSGSAELADRHPSLKSLLILPPLSATCSALLRSRKLFVSCLRILMLSLHARSLESIYHYILPAVASETSVGFQVLLADDRATSVHITCWIHKPSAL